MSWYYAKQGKQEGPVDLEALQAMVGAGEVAPGDLVWKEGMDGWKPAGEIPELTPRPAEGEPHTSGTLGAGPGVASPPPQEPAAPVAAQPVPPAAPAAPESDVPIITPPPPTSTLAVVSLVCGILSLMLCYVWALAGIPAVICGHMALKGIKRAEHRIDGRGMAIAGLVTGYISNVVQVIFIVGVIWLIVVSSNA